MNAAEFDAQEDVGYEQAKKQVPPAATEMKDRPVEITDRPGWVQSLYAMKDIVPNPVDVMKKIDPLSPELPMKERLWNAAMMAGPGGAQAGAMKLIPGGAAAGVPFGKTIEGSMVGLTGGLGGEFGDWASRYLVRGLQGGIKGVAKNFINSVGEMTGLGGNLSKTGDDLLTKAGNWKQQYYDKVYQPIKKAVGDSFPSDGVGVLPAGVIKQLDEQRDAALALNKLTESGKVNAEKYKLAMSSAQNDAEREAANKAYQTALINNHAEEQILRSSPSFQKVGQDPMMTFQDYEHTLENLRNYGWQGLSGEPRKGPLSASERSALHDLKQEMLQNVPDQGLAAQYNTARSHAHGWETIKNIIDSSEYTQKGIKPHISELQRSYAKHVSELQDAFGEDYARVLTKSLFGGREEPTVLGREYGSGAASLHKSPTGGGFSLFAHAIPGFMTGPPLTTIRQLLKTGIPASLAAPLVAPAAQSVQRKLQPEEEE
jgi:hypothetical protein